MSVKTSVKTSVRLPCVFWENMPSHTADEEKRKSQYERGDLTMFFFLKEMGAISRKSDRVTEVEGTPARPAPDEKCDSDSENDSLSETRTIQGSSDSDIEQKECDYNATKQSTLK